MFTVSPTRTEPTSVGKSLQDERKTKKEKKKIAETTCGNFFLNLLIFNYLPFSNLV